MRTPVQIAQQQMRTPSMIRSLTFALLIAGGIGSSISHADPGDFQAMPGLWRTTTSVVSHGRAGKPKIQWHCVLEDNDPWVAFANLSASGTQCTRSDEQRSSTALAWTQTCPGHARMNGQGRVDFDSAEHYTASIVSKNRGELVHVEGQRRAACTDPSD